MSNNPASIVCGTGATSTVSAEKVTGWHVVKVEGYPQLMVNGDGNYVKSASFNVGGHSWYILLYIDGVTWKSQHQVGVVLCLDGGISLPYNVNFVRVRFKFSLLDQAGEPVEKHTITYPSWYTFSCTKMTTGDNGASLISRTDLKSFLKDDSFQLRCDLTVQKIRTKVMTSAESPVMPPTDLRRQFGDLLASKVGADLTFEVNGELITAHRYILAARSPVFMVELYGPAKENVTGHVIVEDMDARVFKILLHFIYTDSLPEIEEGDRIPIAQHLLVAADLYDIRRLKLICEDMLCSSLDISTVLTTLVLAKQHACVGLKSACYEFLKSPGYLNAVMACDAFQHLKNSCPSLLEELLVMVAP